MSKREQSCCWTSRQIAEASRYLKSYGITCVIESTCVEDLKTVWGSTLDMPPELYPILVELAEREIISMQQSMQEYDYCSEDLNTKEERENILKTVAELSNMSPKEFWLNGIKMIDDMK